MWMPWRRAVQFMPDRIHYGTRHIERHRDFMNYMILRRKWYVFFSSTNRCHPSRICACCIDSGNLIHTVFVSIKVMSEITSLMIVYSTVNSDADQRKHQSSASLAFFAGIRRLHVNSTNKGPVMRKMFPFDDVIMEKYMQHNTKTESGTHLHTTPQPPSHPPRPFPPSPTPNYHLTIEITQRDMGNIHQY